MKQTKLYQLRVLPRWIIFLLDLVCMLMAVAIGFLLRFNFNFFQIGSYKLLTTFWAVVLVSSAVFCSLRTYAGIIRHTSLQDAWRVLMAVTAATALYVAINVANAYQGRPFLMPYSVIFIAFFSSFVMLLLYRLIVKGTFDQVVNGRIGRPAVVIYGAGYGGTVTRSVLQAASGDRVPVRVVSFIDDDPYSWGKQLEGVPVHKASVKIMEKLRAHHEVKQLVITDTISNGPTKNAIMEWCLSKGIKVQQIPPMAQWIQGGLKKKQIKDIHIDDLLNRSVIRLNNSELSAQLQQKVVLITGAAGSIGSELVRQVARFTPKTIILCDQAESPLHDLNIEVCELFPHIHFKIFIGDIRNKLYMEQLFSTCKPEVVFHAAAYKHVPMMEQFPNVAVLNNVMGTIHVAEMARKYKVEKFVMISTDKAVNPTNVMGASKRIAEIYIQALNNHLHRRSSGEKNGTKETAFITTRFGNVLGSNGSVVPLFKKQIEAGGPVTITHPEITRYFMTIPEACQLVMEAGVMGKGGEIFVFDMGEAVKIRDLAIKMIQLSGLTPDKDIKLVYTGLRPGEKLYEELLTEKENIIPTYHEKIRIARVEEYDFVPLKEKIHELILTARDGKNLEVVQLMKNLVPEYKSNNSEFEVLDEQHYGESESVLSSAP